MAQLDLKAYIKENLEGASSRFVQDLEALTDAQLQAEYGEGSRKAIDFVYETIFVNQMIATRLRGEEPAKWPWEGSWATAPDGFATAADAIAGIKESTAALQAAVDAVPDDQLLTKVQAGDRETSAFEGANFAALHMMYHDAQLNYLQSIGGDLEMHWK
jgi:hypothetical protein